MFATGPAAAEVRSTPPEPEASNRGAPEDHQDRGQPEPFSPEHHQPGRDKVKGPADKSVQGGFNQKSTVIQWLTVQEFKNVINGPRFKKSIQWSGSEVRVGMV